MKSLMLSFIKCIWRVYHIIAYRKFKIFIHPSVIFNRLTFCKGYNRIHKGTCISNSVIGRNTFIGIDCNLVNVEIGNFCSIAHNVSVEYATHPTHTYVSTSPVFYSTLKQTGQTYVAESCFEEFLSIEGRSCIIGNDVWIGANVLIKGGVRIGDGAIIAMGSVVTKDIPPYSVYGGIPAKFIRKRFEDKYIKQVMDSKWWERDDVYLRVNNHFFRDVDLYCNSITNDFLQ